MNLLKEEAIAAPVGITLDRFIKAKQDTVLNASGEFSQLLRDIALASKIIYREINRAGLSDILGAFGSENPHGEAQQRLDMSAHIRFVRALRNGGEVAAVVSEEEQDIIYTGNQNGKYVVALDPLDGSSNIDVNVSIGTIFSIYRRVTQIGTIPTEADFLQGGDQQVCAGYVLYGSSTILVYTTGTGVNGFTYDHSLGEYFLSHPRMTTSPRGGIYSCNEGNVLNFPVPLQDYLKVCHQRGMTGRYIGSLVGDFHRNLIKGGIYLYPAMERAPEGKLRMLYECYPLAFLIEQAGGSASDGRTRILDIPARSLHQRCGLIIGSSEMVDEVNQMYLENH